MWNVFKVCWQLLTHVLTIQLWFDLNVSTHLMILLILKIKFLWNRHKLVPKHNYFIKLLENAEISKKLKPNVSTNLKRRRKRMRLLLILQFKILKNCDFTTLFENCCTSFNLMSPNKPEKKEKKNETSPHSSASSALLKCFLSWIHFIWLSQCLLLMMIHIA